MNQKITYEELLNLSIDEFNARKNKSIQEILFYLYPRNKVSGLKGYIMNSKEMFRAFIDRDVVIEAIEGAIEDLIEEADDEAFRDQLIEFHEEFIDNSENTENPLEYWGDFEEATNCFLENLSFFFGIFDILEECDYDLSGLYITGESEE